MMGSGRYCLKCFFLRTRSPQAHAIQSLLFKCASPVCVLSHRQQQTHPSSSLDLTQCTGNKINLEGVHEEPGGLDNASDAPNAGVERLEA